MDDLTITKGSITVTLGVGEVAENYANKIFMITPPQSKDNQSNGPKDTKIVDLLRITHELVIRGNITASATKTAAEVKKDLIDIFRGANADGGECTLNYDDVVALDGTTDSLAGYIEKLTINEVSQDDTSSIAGTDNARYQIALTFVEGVEI